MCGEGVEVPLHGCVKEGMGFPLPRCVKEGMGFPLHGLLSSECGRLGLRMGHRAVVDPRLVTPQHLSRPLKVSFLRPSSSPVGGKSSGVPDIGVPMLCSSGPR